MAGRQTTLTSYMYKKGINETGVRPVPSILNRPKDPGSRQHSDIEESKNEYPTMKEVCTLFYVVFPENRRNWSTKQQGLRSLLKNNSNKDTIIGNIRQTIRKSVKFHSIDKINVRNLQGITNYLFWNDTIYKMISLSLQAFSEPIALLVSRINNFVKVKRKDILRCLCHMFFCTMPPQFNMQNCNFSLWYNSSSQRGKSNLQKLKCLVNYFEDSLRASESYLSQYVTYERIHLSKKQTRGMDSGMSAVTFTRNDIFNLRNHQIVDFANKRIGGGVLKNGVVQQEIMFVVHPQLLFASIIFQPLDDNQCGIVHNVRQFSKYQGYSDTFKYSGSSSATTPTTVIMIDAIDFQNSAYATLSNSQYHETQIFRQCHKAYIGFRGNCFECRDEISKHIATGLWGCGAFKGDPELKFLVQWIAASWANKKMTFSVWDKEALVQQNIMEMYEKLRGMKTSEIFNMLQHYQNFRSKLQIKLSDYILDFYV